MANFTYVIGYRHKADRLMNLRRVLDWLSGFSNIEVIIVEQDVHSKLSHLNLRAKHIFVKSKMPYNRSWAFNIALKRATSPIVAFGDSDIVMDPLLFIESLNELQNFDVVSPYRSVVDLDPSETTWDLQNVFKIDRPGRGETDNQKINLCGGIVLFKKESIYRVGGWPEMFVSWGGEDDFETMKINKLGLKTKEMPHRCYHLWHSKEAPDTAYYKNSLEILQRFSNADINLFQAHINAELPKIGSLNKYDI